MDDVMSDKLYGEFMKIVEGGDEAKARAFLVENLKRFPQVLKTRSFWLSSMKPYPRAGKTPT